MDNEEYSNDSLAIMLLCSDLAINFKMDNVKPLTKVQWSKLAKIIFTSSIKKPGNLFNLSSKEIQKELLIGLEESEKIVRLLSKAGQLSFQLNELKNMGIKILTRADKLYPNILKKKLKEKCPPVIYYCGDLSIINNQLIGVVGSRNIDSYGLEFARKVGKKIVTEKYSLVSGGAKGSDSVAQDEVLKNGGKVISFISDSMASKIKKKEIREFITKGNLLLMSATNPKSRFTVYSAMDRNKYIYVLSKITIVVSSDYNKGGTWAGATENLKNKWVPLLVRNEHGVLKGNLELIKLGGNEFNESTFLKPFKEFIKKENNINEEYYEENFFPLINNKKIKSTHPTICTDNLCNNIHSGTHDVYNFVIKQIKEVLTSELSLDQFSKELNINKKQASDWLNRAVKEGVVKKLNGPVRYKSI